jgi:hypothetical protein
MPVRPSVFLVLVMASATSFLGGGCREAGADEPHSAVGSGSQRTSRDAGASTQGKTAGGPAGRAADAGTPSVIDPSDAHSTPPLVTPPPATTTPPPATTTPPPATTTPPPAATTPPPAATTPPPSAAKPPLRIAVVGDFGADNADEAKVAALVKGWKPDAVLTVGDDNYPEGSADTIDANIGKHYGDFIGSYTGKYGAGATSNRFWPSPGNHDWVAADLGPYRDYFTLPGNERYYDVDLGLVHLYAVDSDPKEPDGNTATSKQAGWLKERLAASKSCFDLVFFHHPPYSTGDHGSNDFMRWPFESWGAEGILAGHDHDYERFQVGAIPYFVNGLGGAGIYPFASDPLPETKFRYDAKHGAMLVTATATGVTYEFWSYDGVKVDSYTQAKACD